MTRTLRTAVAVLTGWVLVALVSSGIPGVELVDGGGMRHIPFRVTFLENLLTYSRWALLAPVVVWIVTRIVMSDVAPTRQTLLHLASAGASILLAYLLSLIDLPYSRYPVSLQWSSFLGILPRSAGLYGILAALTIAYASHRKLLLRETQLLEARLQALSAQLHPHFLSNALNGIAALVDARPAEARSMIARLGELLRGGVDATQHREFALTQEIEWVERYLEVQQIRFEDRLQIDVQIAPEVMNAMVPPLILQPIVENAIKHGVEMRAEGGRVSVCADRRDGYLRVRVGNDPGAEAAGTRTAGVGLQNVRARLKALYGARQSLSIARSEGWVEAVLELPFKPMG
jgi:two-component sensor histidine kinase